MFHVGQKVAAINVDFQPWVYDLYKNLPKKNSIYTIRAMRTGRTAPKFDLDPETCDLKMVGAEFDILVLLEELINPNDPHSNVEQELGFRSDRFAPLLEETEEAEDGVLVGAGFGDESTGEEWKNS